MWATKLNILTNRKPFKTLSATKKLIKLMKVIRNELTSRTDPAKLEFVEDGLEKVWNARFISYATGGELDYWGETLAIERNPGESDADYRLRLLNAFRASVNVLTIKALKDAVVPTTDQTPPITELYTQTWDWPFDWQNGRIWQNYERLLDMMAEVSPIQVIDEQFTSSYDTWVDLDHADILDDSETVTTLDGQTTFTRGVDYNMDYPGGRIMVLSTGGMEDATDYLIDYTYQISSSQLTQIENDIEAVKNAPAEVFLVEDLGQGYYIRKGSVL